MQDTRIIATKRCQYFAELIARELNIIQTVPVERKQFGDGERYYRLDIRDRSELVGKDVIVVGTTDTDDDFLEIVRIGNTLADLGTDKRIFVIPFFGYSTMEKAHKPGEVPTAKIQARLLSSMPNAGGGNYFLFLDLHSGGMIHYFEGEAVRFELSAQPLLVKAIEVLDLKNLVLASADLGRPILIQRLASHFNANLAFISKTRDFNKTSVQAVIGNVKGKNVIIYDDMTRSGGTLIQAAKTYRGHGAKAVYAVLSHLAFNNDTVINELIKSNLKTVIGTNSHPMSQRSTVGHKKFSLIDVSPLFARAIENILDKASK